MKKLKIVIILPIVDSFFSYLSSKMLNSHGFLNGLDFYGNFIMQSNRL